MRSCKNTLCLLAIWFLLFCRFTASAQEFKVQASIEKDTFIIGDRIEIKVDLDFPSSHIYSLQKIPQLQGLEWLDSSALQGTSNASTKTYIITGFDSGAFTFPALNFILQNTAKQTVASASTKSFRINLNYVAVDTSQDIKPIIAPLNVDYSPIPWWLYLLGALLLLIIAYLLYRKWKKRPKKPEEISEQPNIEFEEPIHYAEKAILEIKELQNRSAGNEENQNAYWYHLKEVLRKYIAKHYRFRTQEKTSAQILEDIQERPVKQETAQALEEILTKADMVLFAKHNADAEENRKAAEQSISFIRQTLAQKQDLRSPEEDLQ